MGAWHTDKGSMKPSLCWECRLSTSGGCRWSEKLLPVEGWEILENKNGFKVLNCPKFVRDAYKGGQTRPEEYARRQRKKAQNVKIFEGKEYEKA